MRRLLLAAATALATVGLGCGESEEATAGVPPTFFGVAPQDAVSDADLARMSQGKVGSYHLLLSWARVEATEDELDFSSYDDLIGKLAVNGLEPITYVYGTPAWLEKNPAAPPIRSKAGSAEYSDFLTAATRRYGPGGEFWEGFALTHPGVEPQPLHIWEIWNEVNGPAFWAPKPDPGEYAKLLRLSEKTIHREDPDAQIMIAGMFATPSSGSAITSFDFLRELYTKPGVTEATDLVAVHPYGPKISDVSEQMAKTYKEMERGGDGDAGMWVTEFGWGSDTNVKSQLTKTPAKQASLLRKTYNMMIAKRSRWNVQGALWYTWRDAANPESLCGWCGSAGLVDDDLDSKPAWIEFTNLTGGSPG